MDYARGTTAPDSFGDARIEPAMDNRNTMDVEEGIVGRKSVRKPDGIVAQTTQSEGVTRCKVIGLKGRMHEARQDASIHIAPFVPNLKCG